MNGFCGILSSDNISINEFSFIKSIDLAGTLKTQSVSKENYFAAVSYLESTPLKGSRIHKSFDFICLFTGDLIDYDLIPWDEVITNVSNSNFKWFSTLRGNFAFSIFNRKLKQVYLISDHHAQIPVYYGRIGKSIIFSTSIATFTILDSKPDFNIEWLYEYFYFNFPIDTTTCLQNVSSVRSRSIVKFDLKSGALAVMRYAEHPKSDNNILTGKEAYDHCIKTFQRTIPKYYCHENLNLIAISAGFDSRTLLSLAPKKSNLLAYTYGSPHSEDVNIASKLTNDLKLKHKEVLFDNDFKKSLPDLIYDTVRLSGGVQSIIRSTLLYVYRTLFKISENESPIVIGGIGGDLFRGGTYGVNSMISPGVHNYFKTGKILMDKDYYKNIFNTQYSNFENHIEKTFSKIKNLYGDPLNPETHMSYDIFEIDPKYFGGELAIASNYFTLRLPYLDHEIIDLAYKSEVGYLGLSPYTKKEKDISFKKYVFQTKVMSSNLAFKKTFIRGMPVSLYAKGDKLLFQICKLFIRGFAHIRRDLVSRQGLEDWDIWMKNILRKEFDKILNERSLILNYFDLNFINMAKKSNNTQLMSKLVTTEILLNLIKNRWNI